MSVNIIDKDGAQVEVDLKGLLYHEIAATEEMSYRQVLCREFPTQVGKPDAFMQACHAAGLRFQADDKLGIPAANLKEMLNPSLATTNQTGGTYTSSPAIPDSKILFVPALLETVENILNTKEDVATSAFDSLVGYRKIIASDRFEQAVIDFGGKGGPEDVRPQRVAQNARPPLMLSITASDVARTIPTESIGMEISAKALRENSLDIVALAFARMFKKVDYADWVSYLLVCLGGDSNGFSNVMDDNTAALDSVTAQSFDSAVTVAGTITQKAWLKFLYANSMTMNKTHMVTDFDTMLAIENRTGRPTNVQNNSVDRIDTPFRVTYPSFNSTVDILVMPADAGWTANTIMAIDKDSAIAEITSSVADYQAIENQLMKKSTEIRLDRGKLRYRQWTDAFDVMTLTVA